MNDLIGGNDTGPRGGGRWSASGGSCCRREIDETEDSPVVGAFPVPSGARLMKDLEKAFIEGEANTRSNMFREMIIWCVQKGRLKGACQGGRYAARGRIAGQY